VTLYTWQFVVAESFEFKFTIHLTLPLYPMRLIVKHVRQDIEPETMKRVR